jgi:hypothetical protein
MMTKIKKLTDWDLTFQNVLTVEDTLYIEVSFLHLQSPDSSKRGEKRIFENYVAPPQAEDAVGGGIVLIRREFSIFFASKFFLALCL